MSDSASPILSNLYGAFGLTAQTPRRLRTSSHAPMPSGTPFGSGTRVTGVGSSIMRGFDYDLGITGARESKPSDGTWLTNLCFLSDGRLTLISNKGVGGTTSTQCRNSFLADVLPLYPRICFIQACTNDPSPGDGSPALTVAQSIDNLRTMCGYCFDHGITPILCTEIAKDFEQSELAAINYAIRALGDELNVTVLDLELAIMDAATGDPVAAYVFDGTHLTPAGAMQVADYAKAAWLDMADVSRASTSWLTPWDDHPLNLVSKACFASGAIASGAPPGWTAANNTTGGFAVRTLVTPAASEFVQGEWLRFTLADLNGTITVKQTLDLADFTEGDWLTLSFKHRYAGIVAAKDQRWTAGLSFTGSQGAPYPVYKWVGAGGTRSGRASLTYQVPADNTSVEAHMVVAGSGSNEGTVDFAQFTVRNHGSTIPGQFTVL